MRNAGERRTARIDRDWSVYNRTMITSSLLLGLHLVCVNLAAAGPLFCIVVQWRSVSLADEALVRIGKQLLAASLIAFAIGALTGFVNGVLWWKEAPERLVGAMDRLASKIYFGWWELAFYVLCLAIYAAWWKLKPPRSVQARIVQIAANAPLGDAITSSEFRQLMFSPTIFARCVHVWLASLAVSGIALALLAVRARRGSDTASPAIERCLSTGARTALLATMLQALVGAWVLFTSPAIEQARLMGGSLPAMLLLIVSIAAALWLMHLLGSIAVGPASQKQIVTAAAVMAFIIFAMSATMISARGGAQQLPIDSSVSDSVLNDR
jgi:hypothetical protein